MKRSVLVTVLLSVVSVSVVTVQAAPFLTAAMNNSDTIQMFDPYDGTHLGQLLSVPSVYGGPYPVSTTLGPDGYVYVADRNQSAVLRFTQDGTYVDAYAGPEDGLDYVRDIDFRGDELFVSVSSSSGDNFVARFDGPHSRQDDFIADDSYPHGLLFLDDGRLLLSDYHAGGGVRLYDADGNFVSNVLTDRERSQQVSRDPQSPGGFLNIEIYPRQFTDFDLDGTIYVQNTIVLGDTRGIQRLGNGNLLVGCNMGVYEVDSRDGAVIEQELTGNAMYIDYIPEPTTFALLLLGGSALLRRRR